MSDAHPLGDVDGPRLAGLLDEFLDQLDIVFGDLAPMRVAHRLEALCPDLDRRDRLAVHIRLALPIDFTFP